MTGPRPDFDPWKEPPEEIAKHARWWQTAPGDDLDSVDSRRDYVEWLLEVFQARATLEAAERQTKTTKHLVWATWALVGVTLLLAGAAVVALLAD